MAVTFTEPDEPSSSSSADEDGADSADGDSSDEDSASDSGYEEDPRYAAAEVGFLRTALSKICDVSELLTPRQMRLSAVLSLAACAIPSLVCHKAANPVLLRPNAYQAVCELDRTC